MTNHHLGFVGLGRMGGPMVRRLLDAGHEVTVFDVSEEAVWPLVERGAARAGSAAEVASAAEIVMTSLPTPDLLHQAALGEAGIIRGARVSTLVDLSTTGPATATRVAEGLAARRIQWVDAPVSGGVKGACEGTLALMVSCPKGTLEMIRPILEIFGKLFSVGEKPGLAQVAKLGNNLLAAAALVISSEALAMGVKAGLDPQFNRGGSTRAQASGFLTHFRMCWATPISSPDGIVEREAHAPRRHQAGADDRAAQAPRGRHGRADRGGHRLAAPHHPQGQ